MVKTDHLLSICSMKHYISKAMLEQQISRLRQEITDYEKQNMQSGNSKPKHMIHITKLRQQLHELKHTLNVRTNQTILKNGRK
jgi:hypothetical protein